MAAALRAMRPLGRRWFCAGGAGGASGEGVGHVSIDRSGLLGRGMVRGSAPQSDAGATAGDATPLGLFLREMIELRGPVSLAVYMQHCLTHPVHGYYMSNDVFGTAGDFVTSPEISQLFGEIVGLWAAHTWMGMGSPEKVTLVELGPGRGTLMADVFRVAGKVPGLADALSVEMVEASPALTEIQRRALTAANPNIPVEWSKTLTTVEMPDDVPFIVLAHEFFDALPVYRFVMTDKGWREVLVDVGGDDGGFRFVVSPDPTPASELLVPKDAEDGPHAHWGRPEVGSAIEVSPMSQLVAEDLGQRMAKNPRSAALFMDYGDDRTFSDSVVAIRDHKFVDVLQNPGLADLSAMVNFGALAQSALKGVAADNQKVPDDFRIIGPVDQAEFLATFGIRERLEALLRVATPDQAKELQAGFDRLVGEDQMGKVYKVMAVVRGAV